MVPNGVSIEFHTYCLLLIANNKVTDDEKNFFWGVLVFICRSTCLMQSEATNVISVHCVALLIDIGNSRVRFILLYNVGIKQLPTYIHLRKIHRLFKWDITYYFTETRQDFKSLRKIYYLLNLLSIQGSN